MSNRTQVTLIVGLKDKEFILKHLLKLHEIDLDSDDVSELISDEGSYTHLFFDNIEEAILDFEDLLEKVSIPFCKTWLPTLEFNGGQKFCQVFPDGKVSLLSSGYRGIGDVSIDYLVNCHKEGRLIDVLREERRKTFVMDWDLQLKISEARYEVIDELSKHDINQLKDLFNSFIDSLSITAKEKAGKMTQAEFLIQVPEQIRLPIIMLNFGYQSEKLKALEILTDEAFETHINF